MRHGDLANRAWFASGHGQLPYRIISSRFLWRWQRIPSSIDTLVQSTWHRRYETSGSIHRPAKKPSTSMPKRPSSGAVGNPRRIQAPVFSTFARNSHSGH